MADCDIVGPHLESFNCFIDGLEKAVADIEPEEFQVNVADPKSILRLKIESVKINMPSSSNEDAAKATKIYPSECRQRGLTYGGKMRIRIAIRWGDYEIDPIEKQFSDFPIMLKSKLCNLHGLPTKEVMRRGEEEREMGGYFIVNGTEKIIRLLVVNRRNYPMAINRNGWKKRGVSYTEQGIFIRTVRDSHTATMNTLHYLMSRRMMLCFSHQREMFFVPAFAILRAFVDYPESYIYNALMCGREKDDLWEKSIKNMMSDLHKDGVFDQMDALRHLGENFRVSLQAPAWLTDVQVGQLLLRKCVLIHLDDDREKFELLSYMMQKLRAFVAGECREDDPDNIMFHEMALPGNILLMLVKDRLEVWLERLRRQFEVEIKNKGVHILSSAKKLSEVLKIAMKFDISRAIEHFLATGTLQSKTGLGMQQTTGFTIIAERLNYLRFVSHFRGIHRGAFFTTMRATEVRKLKPEAWGFLCPVNTPDGTPCGLLNHLSAPCRTVAVDQSRAHLKTLTATLSSRGMLSLDEFRALGSSAHNFTRVVVDSYWLGWIADDEARNVADFLRLSKLSGADDGRSSFFNPFAEVVFIEKSTKPGTKTLYPGLYVFNSPARFLRPVINLKAESAVEYIGTIEQIFLSICVDKSEFIEGVTTHQEVHPCSFMSFSANLIPFSDHNQSPRNVYQCQMGKQTMGIPVHRLDRRVDNKLYRLQTPQSPLVKPDAYDVYGIDDYGLGTNAIVAVISYTGYDMEDSMVINKTSYERGFAQASILKTEKIELHSSSAGRVWAQERLEFRRDPSNPKLVNYVDCDGLPYIGQLYRENHPFCCYVSLDTGKFVTKSYHHSEPAYVHQVKVCDGSVRQYGQKNENSMGKNNLNTIRITWRAERNPGMGDKFASRHGQKGMMSFLWPTENMPFTESGMVPDIIFNPHGFPSRMTVGMMLEFLAGKSAAVHGVKHNAAPFIFSEDSPAVKYFGDSLEKAGYNYLGNEPLYSGVDGRELKADIFFGVVYYQKLRHMVEDKFQVRSTGPIDDLTGQPVHGRKRGGGVRFGEMERDALISHGCAFLLQDRLFDCSDKDYTNVCAKCGCTIGIAKQIPSTAGHAKAKEDFFRDSSLLTFCRLCQSADHVTVVAVPTVLKLLMAELSCMNIKTKFTLAAT